MIVLLAIGAVVVLFLVLSNFGQHAAPSAKGQSRQGSPGLPPPAMTIPPKVPSPTIPATARPKPPESRPIRKPAAELSEHERELMARMEEMIRLANDPEEIWKASNEAYRDLTELDRRDPAQKPLSDDDCKLVLAYLMTGDDDDLPSRQRQLNAKTSGLAKAIIHRWSASGRVVVCDNRWLAALGDSMTAPEKSEYRTAQEGARRETLREMNAALRKLNGPAGRTR
jgi:hypothetical protein